MTAALAAGTAWTELVFDLHNVAAITTPLDWLSFAAGLLLVYLATASVIRTLIMTRATRSWISAGTGRMVWLPFRVVSQRFENYLIRDRILTWVAPLSIVSMLLMWLVLFLLGYSLILNAENSLSFADSIREAGSSLFTLGFASTDRAQLTAVDFVAAATGPIVIGLMIGYLPTLYSSYNRREVDVALLNARAGEPNWGPEVLLRHAIAQTQDQLPELWSSWERWSADVAESHSTYPMLIVTRSARPQRNWWVALLAVMDSAALNLSLRPNDDQGPPRVCLRQGLECMRDLAGVMRIDYDDDPDPDSDLVLTFDEFAKAVKMLDSVGYQRERDLQDAWTHFKGWRVNYEHIAYTLAARLDAVPAPWSGPRKPPTQIMMPVRPVNRMPGGTTGMPRLGLHPGGADVDTDAASAAD